MFRAQIYKNKKYLKSGRLRSKYGECSSISVANRAQFHWNRLLRSNSLLNEGLKMLILVESLDWLNQWVPPCSLMRPLPVVSKWSFSAIYYSKASHWTKTDGNIRISRHSCCNKWKILQHRASLHGNLHWFPPYLFFSLP